MPFYFLSIYVGQYCLLIVREVIIDIEKKTIYGVIGLFVYSLEMLYMYIKYKKRFGYKYILKLGEIFYV